MGTRIAATLIDLGVLALTVTVIAQFAGLDIRHDAVNLVRVAVLAFGLVFAGLSSRRGGHNGQTIGKQVMGIRVVREDAAPLRVGTALLRELGAKSVLSLIPFYQLIDDAFALGDTRRQALHDKIARTFVVRADAVPRGPAEERPTAWGPPASQAPPPR